MGLYISTKTYTHEEGLSCCFRQWKAAHTNCNLLHGYALGFRLVFECHRLDDNNWTIDSSSIDHIGTWLKSQFDHTLIIAEDDPELATFQGLHDKGLCNLKVLPATGCEKFAEHVFKYVMAWLVESNTITRATIRSVECMEHDGNSALYVE